MSQRKGIDLPFGSPPGLPWADDTALRESGRCIVVPSGPLTDKDVAAIEAAVKALIEKKHQSS